MIRFLPALFCQEVPPEKADDGTGGVEADDVAEHLQVPRSATTFPMTRLAKEGEGGVPP